MHAHREPEAMPQKVRQLDGEELGLKAEGQDNVHEAYPRPATPVGLPRGLGRPSMGPPDVTTMIPGGQEGERGILPPTRPTTVITLADHTEGAQSRRELYSTLSGSTRMPRKRKPETAKCRLILSFKQVPNRITPINGAPPTRGHC